MQRQAVKSSNIASVGYDPAARVLEVEFRNGGTYHYHDVAPETHAQMVANDSVGTFFHKHVKTVCACTKGEHGAERT